MTLALREYISIPRSSSGKSTKNGSEKGIKRSIKKRHQEKHQGKASRKDINGNESFVPPPQASSGNESIDSLPEISLVGHESNDSFPWLVELCVYQIRLLYSFWMNNDIVVCFPMHLYIQRLQLLVWKQKTLTSTTDVLDEATNQRSLHIFHNTTRIPLFRVPAGQNPPPSISSASTMRYQQPRAQTSAK